MIKNYKNIKNLLLLSALSIYMHSNVSATNMDVDRAITDLDKLERKNISKQTNEQADFNIDESDTSKNSSFKKDSLSFTEKPSVSKSTFEEIAYFPDNVINNIIQFLDLSKDKDALLAFLVTNTRIHQLIEDKYTKANEHENHRPWQVPLPLSKPLSSTLYILNTRMRTILGLYVNINMVNNIDRIRFERLCSPFIITPLFLKNTLPAMYVELLQLHLSIVQPTIFQERFAHDWKSLLLEKRQICSRELSTIVSQQNLDFQNEGALYFHYCQFVEKVNLVKLHNTPFFRQLKNSFMAVMNKELLDLKATLNLSVTGNFAPIWEKILALEPAITIKQLNMAASSHFQVGRNATAQSIKLANFTKAGEYYEKQLEVIIGARQTPAAADYGDIANAYLEAGHNGENLTIRAANFARAVEHLEKRLEAIIGAKQTPAAADYGNTANAYLEAGRNATAQSIKLANFTKAGEYYEKQLEAIIGAKQTLTVTDYGDIASIYKKAGWITKNLAIKAANFARAAEYFEKRLKAIIGARQTPAAADYLNIADTYNQIGCNAENFAIKAANFTKAGEYYEKQLEAIIGARKTPSGDNYRNAAYAYFEAGKFAENVNTKAKNYTKAKTYLEAYLEIGLNKKNILHANAVFKDVIAFFSDNNKIASGKITDDGTVKLTGID